MEFNYVELAMRTKPKLEKYPFILERMGGRMVEVLEALNAIKKVGIQCDLVKKHVFYGRETETSVFPYASSEIIPFVEDAKSNVQSIMMVDLVHAIIGKATELSEMIECFEKALLHGKELDKVNMGEEKGDDFWYDALLAHALGIPFEKMQTTNIRKLAERFKEEFTEFEANNRDLTTERELLEKNLNETEKVNN